MSLSNFWRKVFLRRSHRRAGKSRLPQLRCLAAGFEMLEIRNMLSVSLSVVNNQTYLPEFGGQATVQASLSAPLTQNVLVPLNFSGNYGTDYTASAATITIPAGSTSGTITLSGGNTAIAGNETVGASINAGLIVGDSVGSPSSVNITIGNTSLPTVNDFQFSTGVFEKNGQVTLSVGLDNPTLVDLALPLVFSGNAVEGTDYSVSNASIFIPAGSSTGSITLTGNYTASNTGRETITATLGNLVNVQLGSTTSLTEPLVYPQAVSLSLASGTLAENGGTDTIYANLSTPATVNMQVPLLFSGTAINGTNYSASANFIEIGAGNSSGSITLTALDNANYTGNRTIVASLDSANLVNATSGSTTQVTATEVDSLAPPTVTLSVANATLAENGGTDTIYANLSAPAAVDVHVPLKFTGTAAQGTNYSTSANFIDIQPGNTTGSITLTALDTGYTVNQTVVASLDSANLANATPGAASQVTATIYDTEPPPTVNLSLSSAVLARNGGSDTIYANLSAAAGVPVTVPLVFSGSTANIPVYSASESVIVIQPGSTSGSITLTGVAGLYTGNQSLTVSLGNLVNAAAGAASPHVTATVVDADPPPAVNLSLSSSTLAESGGSDTLTATLSAAAGVDVTVPLTFSGTAAAGTDYAASDASIYIPAGLTTGTITLNGVGIGVSTGNKTLTVGLGTLTKPRTSATPQVTAAVIDAAAPPASTLSLGAASRPRAWPTTCSRSTPMAPSRWCCRPAGPTVR